MKHLVLDFYNTIGKKKSFWIPLLLLIIVAYGFPMFQRTVSWDDFGRDKFIGSGHVSLAGRWGMVVYARLLNVVDFSPFIDKFLAAFFLFFACCLACVVFYKLNPIRKILPYTILASTIATYPLIVEICEFTIAGFVNPANMCLVTLALLFILSDEIKFRWKTTIAGALLLTLPISSYESSIFYYLVFVFIILFYNENYLNKCYSFTSLVKEGIVFAWPVVGALIIRILVTLLLLGVFGLTYNAGGATGIYWDFTDILGSVRLLVMRTGFFYGLVGLVYPPIFIFLICAFLFVCYFIVRSFMARKWIISFLGIFILIVLFLQAIIQGDVMPYRTVAICFSLFVAFVFYSVCEIFIEKKVYPFVVAILMLGCFHQAVYINKILSLNNLRSDNELSALRYMGYRLENEFDQSKPVIFVTSYKEGDWLKERSRVSKKTWNGRLFINVTHSLMGDSKGPDGEDMFNNYKYTKSILSPFTGYYRDLEYVMSYLGFHINLLKPANYETQEEYRLFESAINIAKKENLRPYSILEQEEFIVATLSNDRFYDAYGY